MKQPDIKLTKDDIIEYNEKIVPLCKDIEPIYSLVTRARNHNIKGGDNIEIDIYLTGLGIPDANKLVLVWSSPNIIDNSSPGVATYCIREFRKKLNGKDMVVPVTSEELTDHIELGPAGIILYLLKAFFLPVPKSEELVMPQIMAERNSAGYHPMSISLKTLKKAKPGNYKIDITLTYKYRNIVKQASDKVEFHITNWWDRNQRRVGIAGIVSAIFAFILLLLTFLNIFSSIGS